MPELSEQTRAILKNDPAFEGLDFTAMRAEAIEYLAELSGKIWTDHNVHDPGITLLELLVYALIDLGYRTRLPAIDLFTPDPNAGREEDNFLTPGQILTCNPVTIPDFRKLLMDIKEVKNAWLEVHEADLGCEPVLFRDVASTVTIGRETCQNFLNGLYQVYIELYKGPYTPENQWSKKEKEYIETVVEKVRKVLMAHRNLCEDFVAITVLCKEKVGVCADIELEPGADAEKVYVKLIETLKAFFSPDARFYTLPQLLDHGKPIEEIFAGRPYLPESHGFIDMAELEAIRMRKEIQVSDIYGALFGIPGIKTIRRLRLQQCGSNSEKTGENTCDWKYQLPENHTAEFSLECSGFRFTRNGMPVTVDEKKYRDYFSLNYSLSGKILHRQQVPDLDLFIPKGFYHADLGKHYSVLNDLPQVYGVGEGGIPDSAPARRKAQALQLKGYLLFFDQLLANYLTQLSQIRQLFTFRNAGNATSTYFSALPLLVPDFNKLQRFGESTGQDFREGLGARPVDKRILDDLIAQDILKETDLENYPEKMDFLTAADRDTAVFSLSDDFRNRNFSILTVQIDSDRWFFYLFTASDQVALLAQTYYPDEKSARLAAENLAGFAAFQENYRCQTNAGTGASTFGIGLNMAGYPVYLQQLAENKTLYLERKKAFLDHLLARFAESFTDFALLSFGTVQEENRKQQDLSKKADFLSSYDQLSRDRGKAYDYLENGWNNANISGFEKRVKAYAGMGESCGQSLCHFQVHEYTGQYGWEVAMLDRPLFKSHALFTSESEAIADLKAFVAALKNEQSYRTDLQADVNSYGLCIQYKGQEVWCPTTFFQAEDAIETGLHLQYLVKGEPAPGEIWYNRENFRPELVNSRGEVVGSARQAFETRQQALSAAGPLVKKIGEADWEPVKGTLPGMKPMADDPLTLVDLTPFSTTVAELPESFRWQFHDPAGDLVLVSSRTYSTRQEALESIPEELIGLDLKESLRAFKDEEGFRFELRTEDDRVLATSPAFPNVATRNRARKAAQTFWKQELDDQQFTYFTEEAFKWQVSFGRDLNFRCLNRFSSAEYALKNWDKVREAFLELSHFAWETDENDLRNLIVRDAKGRLVSVMEPLSEEWPSGEEILAAIKARLAENAMLVNTVIAEGGFGFRLHDDNGKVRLAGFEVFKSRGEAFFAATRALEKAGQKGVYHLQNDSRHDRFTFYLKNNSDSILAGHPDVYITEEERDAVLQQLVTYFHSRKHPVHVGKGPVQFGLQVYLGDNLLLTSTDRFPNRKAPLENLTSLLRQAVKPENYRLRFDPETGTREIILVEEEKVLATLPGYYTDAASAEVFRNQVLDALQPHVYQVQVSPEGADWKFTLSLGFGPDRAQFASLAVFESATEARQAYLAMVNDLEHLFLKLSGENTELVAKERIGNVPITAILQTENQPEAAAAAGKALEISRVFRKLATAGDKTLRQQTVRKDVSAQRGTFVYRLVHSDDYFAFHTNCNEASADPEDLMQDLYDGVTSGLYFLQLCLGGDLTWQRKDPQTGELFYHYLLKTRNFTVATPNGERELVLFVSTQGYISREEAEKAFELNYLQILKRASLALNYGNGRYISLQEMIVGSGNGCSGRDQAVVFVPGEAIQYFGDETAAVDALVEIAKSYPVRLSGKEKYKFSLYDYSRRYRYFVSSATYGSPSEAMEAFYFLLVLLKKAVNYYVNCDPDSGRQLIVIKEVLLESAGRFPTRDTAWGYNGIDKLIGVSHTEDSFHLYLDPATCCYSFFVACKGKLIHPCTYDTAVARDQALEKLVAAFSGYVIPELPLVTLRADGLYYQVTYKGEMVAELPKGSDTSRGGPCTRTFLYFLEKVLQLKPGQVRSETNRFLLRDEDLNEICHLDNPAISRDEWLTVLVEMALQFPVFREEGFYYFRIPFPGSPILTDGTERDPCGCDQAPCPEPAECYLAWVGGCYQTCEDALAALQALPAKLGYRENYRAVFDCKCGSYRVEFIETADIIAVNPQGYKTREMVCEAVEKARKLMNCEGMHLVEHILLRPQADCPEHCDCLIPDCPDPDCGFTWEGYPEEDPCLDSAAKPCFIPGQDPYSCIATVILPAWSARFQQQANRDLVTRILHREAPAHIMLRVLWLSPQALCTLETAFKGWRRWLARKKDLCGGNFDLCDFIELLFRTPLRCWWPNDYCEACQEENPVADACFGLNSQEHRGGGCSYSVNDWYCWSTPHCCYEYLRVPLQAGQETELKALFRNRQNGYQKSMAVLQKQLPEVTAIQLAAAFVQEEQGNAKTVLEKLVKLLTQTRDVEIKPLFQKALETVAHVYLDRNLLQDYDPNALSDINRTIGQARMADHDRATVLQSWKGEDLSAFVHSRTFEALRGIFNH